MKTSETFSEVSEISAVSVFSIWYFFDFIIDFRTEIWKIVWKTFPNFSFPSSRIGPIAKIENSETKTRK